MTALRMIRDVLLVGALALLAAVCVGFFLIPSAIVACALAVYVMWRSR